MDKKIQTDGIIFDVDGTLWDSTESVAAAWNEILEHRPDVSFRATPDNLKKLFGRPLPVIASTNFCIRSPGSCFPASEKRCWH